MHAGRPRSQIALRAARTVRPVNRTSSTSTTSAPSTSKGISVPAQHGPAFALAQIVAVERDIDGADVDILVRAEPRSSRASRSASGTPRVRTPTR